ncbi:MAG: hypothetical protein ACO34E_01510 [Limisphaerales bacterium]
MRDAEDLPALRAVVEEPDSKGGFDPAGGNGVHILLAMGANWLGWGLFDNTDAAGCHT